MLNDDSLFTEVENDSFLQRNYDDIPVYAPPLKAVLTVGHYVFVLATLVHLLLQK